MDDDADAVQRAWTAFVDGLRTAGGQLAASTDGLDPTERADGYRALLRGLANQLGRFEVDRERPELVPFNGWRTKMFLDNPDFRYWVADIRDDRRYRVTGCMGEAVYMSITAYSTGSALDAVATARIDSDSLDLDADGCFDVTVSADAPSVGDWLELPGGASVIWVRQFYSDAASECAGWCDIDRLNDAPTPPVLEPGRLAHRLGRLAGSVEMMPAVISAAVREDTSAPNRVRRWTEMAGGAVFTEPNIDYLRGAWQLQPDEALVIEGEIVPCRYWNVMLYSRFLNSLDHRNRRVSLTGGTAHLHDGRYRVVISAIDPGGHGDWLDSEGRGFGLFVFRFLQSEGPPELPTLSVRPIGELMVQR